MDAFKISVKFYASGTIPELPMVIPVFHRWIQTHAVLDHLLIDVADYAHVSGGPGVVLVSSEANIYFEHGESRPGLLYARKTALPGPFENRLRDVIGYAISNAKMLEQDPALPGLKFDANEILIRLDDRLLAPNNDATYAAVEPAIQAIAKELFGDRPTQLVRGASKEKLFEVRIKSSGVGSLSALSVRQGAAV